MEEQLRRRRARYKGPAAPPWKETYRRVSAEQLYPLLGPRFASPGRAGPLPSQTPSQALSAGPGAAVAGRSRPRPPAAGVTPLPSNPTGMPPAQGPRRPAQRGTNGFRVLCPPQRCMERLRSSRAKLLDRYRQAGERVCGPATGTLLVREVMEQEWQTLQAAQDGQPPRRGTEALAQVSTSSLGPVRSPAPLRQCAT